MAMQMLADLCSDSADKWQECEQTVNAALEARIGGWDGSYAEIQTPYKPLICAGRLPARPPDASHARTPETTPARPPNRGDQ